MCVDAVLVSSRKLNGDVYVASSGGVRLVGAEGKKVAKIPLEVDLPENSRVKEAFLDISITSYEDPAYVKWRLWIDGFQLAREFKPIKSVSMGGEGHYSKVVYDVTPVLDANSRSHVVTILYEGYREILIDHVSLVIPYEAADAETSYSYLAIGEALNLGERAEVEVELPGLSEESPGEFRVACIMPSKSARASFKLNGETISVLSGNCGLEELEFTNVHLKPRGNILSIHHEGGEVQYYPRYMKLSNAIFKASKYRLPRIRVVGIEKLEDRLVLKLVNEGEVAPDKAIATLISAGEIYGRTVFDMPEGEALVEVPILKKPRPGVKVTLRIIWRKLNNTYTLDEELEL